jgi:hypothetical protein
MEAYHYVVLALLVVIVMMLMLQWQSRCHKRHKQDSWVSVHSPCPPVEWTPVYARPHARPRYYHHN